MKVIDRVKITLTEVEQEIALPILVERANILNRKQGLFAEDCIIESNKPVTLKIYKHDKENVFKVIPHDKITMSSIYIDENEICEIANSMDKEMMPIGSVIAIGEIGTIIKMQLTYSV